jgi:hypothetical protein
MRVVYITTYTNIILQIFTNNKACDSKPNNMNYIKSIDRVFKIIKETN